MIKRLRAKFIGITMVLVAMLLFAIFGLVCYSTWVGMRSDADMAMQSATTEPMRPGEIGGDEMLPTNLPCFVLSIDPFGKLDIRGSGYYDLSDTDALLEILEAAKGSDDTKGILWQWKLRYMVVHKGPAEQYVFMDITTQLQTMESLVLSCFFMYFASLAMFFGISWWLSRWMIRPVEQAWQRQRQFVADASHELKTPLTVILTNAELLQSGEYDDQANQRFSGSILTMANQMRSLVESMLDLARVDGRNANRQMTTVDFSDLAENCVMSFEPVYFEADRQLCSTIQPGLYVSGDPRQLQQVVDILLDNGRKYSTPGTQVTLTVEHSRNRCLLQVRSHGQALTERQCRDIFLRFYRLDEARSRNGSYGLGLPIAQAIVSEHRGKIWAHSKAGCNTFCVSLPLTSDPR